MTKYLKNLLRFNKKYSMALSKEFIKLSKRQILFEGYTRLSMTQKNLKMKMTTIDSSASLSHQASKSTLQILTITLLFLINQLTTFYKGVLYLIQIIKIMVNLSLKKTSKTEKKTMIIFLAKLYFKNIQLKIKIFHNESVCQL